MATPVRVEGAGVEECNGLYYPDGEEEGKHRYVNAKGCYIWWTIWNGGMWWMAGRYCSEANVYEKDVPLDGWKLPVLKEYSTPPVPTLTFERLHGGEAGRRNSAVTGSIGTQMRSTTRGRDHTRSSSRPAGSRSRAHRTSPGDFRYGRSGGRAGELWSPRTEETVDLSSGLPDGTVINSRSNGVSYSNGKNVSFASKPSSSHRRRTQSQPPTRGIGKRTIITDWFEAAKNKQRPPGTPITPRTPTTRSRSGSAGTFQDQMAVATISTPDKTQGFWKGRRAREFNTNLSSILERLELQPYEHDLNKHGLSTELDVQYLDRSDKIDLAKLVGMNFVDQRKFASI